jgi:hypothetical protein
MEAQSISPVFDSLLTYLSPKLPEECRKNLVCIEIKRPRRNGEYEHLLYDEKIKFSIF